MYENNLKSDLTIFKYGIDFQLAFAIRNIRNSLDLLSSFNYLDATYDACTERGESLTQKEG
jgi:hypothetical protein